MFFWSIHIVKGRKDKHFLKQAGPFMNVPLLSAANLVYNRRRQFFTSKWKILQINLHNFVQNSSTCFQMFHKVGFYIESLVASSTFKQLALVVGLHVGPQVGSVRKFLPTVGTAKWFLPCVGPHVALQQPGSGESLATHVTLVAEAVGEDVHGEGR